MIGPSPPDGAESAARRAPYLALLFFLICSSPHLGRLRHPSLYTDDVVRIAQLQTAPFFRLLFLPFNEHVAPAFQMISWITWNCAGRRLAGAPLAFTLASYLPFFLTLGLLGRLARRETGSVPAARVAMAAFSGSWLHAETIYWYSASSFMWALLAALIAWQGVAAAHESGSRRGMWASILGAMLAPACSSIGLLAGPFAACRACAAGGRRARAPWLALAPLAGTGCYVAAYLLLRSYTGVQLGGGRRIELVAGLSSAARSTSGLLLPGLLGLPPLVRRLPDWLSVGTFAVALSIALLWGWRGRAARPLIWGGLTLIVGGYVLTFGARAGSGPLVQRYELFPQAGLSLLLACLLRPWFDRLRARPGHVYAIALGLSLLLLALHLPGIRWRGGWYRFPDQPATLAALDRLASIARDRGVTRVQMIAALDPSRREWFPFDPSVFNLWEMLPATVEASRVPDRSVRATLFAALTPEARSLLSSRPDATRKSGRRRSAVGLRSGASGGSRIRVPGPKSGGLRR